MTNECWDARHARAKKSTNQKEVFKSRRRGAGPGVYMGNAIAHRYGNVALSLENRNGERIPGLAGQETDLTRSIHHQKVVGGQGLR